MWPTHWERRDSFNKFRASFYINTVRLLCKKTYLTCPATQLCLQFPNWSKTLSLGISAFPERLRRRPAQYCDDRRQRTAVEGRGERLSCDTKLTSAVAGWVGLESRWHSHCWLVHWRLSCQHSLVQSPADKQWTEAGAVLASPWRCPCPFCPSSCSPGRPLESRGSARRSPSQCVKRSDTILPGYPTSSTTSPKTRWVWDFVS